MDTKFVLFFVSISLISLFACDNCNEDEYGNKLELVVPFRSFPASDTLMLGDTLWLEARFAKDVYDRINSKTIFLDSFNFFTELIISEISDTIEVPDPKIIFIEEIGTLTKQYLTTAVVYHVAYVESELDYSFKFGLILENPGLYLLSLNTYYGLFERYDHEAVFICDNKRRDKVSVYYDNESTSLRNYEDVFLKTKVPYLLDTNLVDYERFKSGGSVAFVLDEP